MVYQIDDSTAVPTLPALPTDNVGTPGFFTGGSTSGGAPTRVRYWWLNMVQEELRNIAVAAGITPSKTDNTQVLTALRALLVQLGGGVSQAGTKIYLGIGTDETNTTLRISSGDDPVDLGIIPRSIWTAQGDSQITEFHYSSGLGNRVAYLLLGAESYIPLANFSDAQMASANPVPFTVSGTYTVPAGVTRVFFELIGGGGAGGMCTGTDMSESIYAAGGGVGAFATGVLFVKPGDTITVSIGSGGASPTSTVGGTTYGGTSSISVNGTTLIECTGAQSGTWSDSTHAGGGSPGRVNVLGTAAQIDVTRTVNGGYGEEGQSGTNPFKGHGGASYYGGAGRAGSGGGIDANGYGSGGGGAYDLSLSGTHYSGGAGGPGFGLLTPAP